jgi:predicted nucleic acid-binding protein
MARLAEQASAIAVSRISWVEAMAGLSRRAREQPRDATAIESCKLSLCNPWPDFAIIEVSQKLTEVAGDIADAFALRAYDSVQLASARIMKEKISEDFLFACFDRRLNKAAAMLSMESFGMN